MDSPIYNEENCVLCQEAFENSSDAILVTRGITNHIKFSNLREDAALEARLSKESSTKPLGKVLVLVPVNRLI